VAHWRFGNINRQLVLRLAVPGSIGALIGVTVLANVDGDTLKPILSLLLLVVAVRILWRFSRPLPAPAVADGRGSDAEELYDSKGTAVAGGVGGVTNGLVGAWGPVVTPFLLHRGLAPRIAIGSVNTAEVAVAFVASGSLLASIGGGGIDVGMVVAMIAGGVLAAPLAAWVIRFLPPRALGVAVGGLLSITNLRELTSGDFAAVKWPSYALVVLACIGAAVRPLVQRSQPERVELLA
jgi:uncharacterized membrane protein YfcA